MEATVVYGRNAVRELVRAARRPVREVWATQEATREKWVPRLHPRIVGRAELGRACGSSDHQGIVAFTEPYPYVSRQTVLDAPGPIICLDQVQDPHNVGAIARSVDATAAAGLVLTERGSPGVTPAVCKSSAGAVEHIRICKVANLASFLHDAKGGGLRWVVGADADADQDFRTADIGGSTILVVGAEGAGLRPRVRAMCDVIVQIPMRGNVDSLNVSVTAGLLLYQADKPSI